VVEGQAVRIGELANQTGVSKSRIRFYEAEGLLAPATRSANGYRSYTERDAKVMSFIDRARRLGFSLKELRTFLADHAGTSSGPMELVRMLEHKLGELDAHIIEARRRRREISALLRDLNRQKTG